MTFIVVQRGTWPGWPGGVVQELESGCASAVLTAARDYQAESHRNLNGDISALPVGCLRTAAQVAEMQWAFDHRHDSGANGAKSSALYIHYNMDRGSNARPSSTSPHLTGFCVDIADNGFLAWLIVNGVRYGLKRTLVKENDLRHFQYFPGTATAALDVYSITDTAGDDPDMFTFGSNNRGGWVGGNGGTRLANPEEWSQVSGKFPHFEFGTNDRAFDVFKAAVTTLPTISVPPLTEAQLAAIAAAVEIPAAPAVPTAAEVATEVIRQMKLPGN